MDTDAARSAARAMSSGSSRTPRWALEARGHWRYTGQERPPFAATPQPGQESVWDYPRPPRIEAVPDEVIVRVGSFLVARTQRALRVLETASPPTFYLPLADLVADAVKPAGGSSRCEWKGVASYWDVVAGESILERAAWSYADPLPGSEAIRDHLCFYPARLECFVAGVRVTPQPGSFYGGWVTPDLVGPFKGEPGSGDW